jgi:hypothetical protein
MLHLLQWLYTYVAKVGHQYVSCVLFSGCMLQVCISRCCICLTHTLHVFYLDVALVAMVFKCFQLFFSSVSEACFKYFIYLQIYVATDVYGRFKSRSGVASLYSTLCCIVSVCPPPDSGMASI